MRLNCKLTGNTDEVPFNHLGVLTSTFHKWYGPDNDLHDATSLYGFGWLHGATVRSGALHFPQGATWTLSFHDEADAHRVTQGILADPTVGFGMRVFDVQHQVTPAYSGCVRFEVASPVVTRTRRADGSQQYLLHDDPEATDSLTRTLRWKLKQAGFESEHLESTVQFDRTYPNAHEKLSTIKGIDYKGSICPVVVTGTPEAVQFAWNVGVGELTGCGFGALK